MERGVADRQVGDPAPFEVHRAAGGVWHSYTGSHVLTPLQLLGFTTPSCVTPGRPSDPLEDIPEIVSRPSVEGHGRRVLHPWCNRQKPRQGVAKPLSRPQVTVRHRPENAS